MQRMKQQINHVSGDVHEDRRREVAAQHDAAAESTAFMGRALDCNLSDTTESSSHDSKRILRSEIKSGNELNELAEAAAAAASVKTTQSTVASGILQLNHNLLRVTASSVEDLSDDCIDVDDDVSEEYGTRKRGSMYLTKESMTSQRLLQQQGSIEDDHDVNQQSIHSGKVQDGNTAEKYVLNFGRLLVIGSILIGGVLISGSTYWILHRKVERKTQKAFELISVTLATQFKFQVSNLFNSNRELSRAITYSSFSTNETFPFVRIPAFEAYAFDARQKGKFDEIIYSPVVLRDDLQKWLNFSNTNRQWIIQSTAISDKLTNETSTTAIESSLFNNLEDSPSILNTTYFIFNGNSTTLTPFVSTDTENDVHAQHGILYPIFQTSPPPRKANSALTTSLPVIDLASNQVYHSVSAAAIELKECVFSSFSPGSVFINGKVVDASNGIRNPISVTAQPVYRTLKQNSKDVVGYIYSVLQWEKYFIKLLPHQVKGIELVLRNSCNQAVTYNLQGRMASFVAGGDFHDKTYENEKVTVNFTEYYLSDQETINNVAGHCQIYLDLYPTKEFKSQYASPLPVIVTIIVCSTFFSMAVVFLMYDRYVSRRNEKVIKLAFQSNAIVASLFPSNIASRLLQENEYQRKDKKPKERGERSYDQTPSVSFKMNDDGRGQDMIEAPIRTLKGFLSAGPINSPDGGNGINGIEKRFSMEHSYERNGDIFKTKPIADLFPNTTVLFADIVGFTAWSSVREPSQVFTLLESIYHSFDEIARRRKVFKVETIGDCYVAVCGLPTPRNDHAVTMARFSKECMYRMWSVTKNLERSLGPDTGDLTMRMGLHSGPVTGGVLRGEKARFQLFGDTVNTAARIESTGLKSKIHLSTEAAELIISGGKAKWVVPRKDKVYAKGKGEMSTFWLNLSITEETTTEVLLQNESRMDSNLVGVTKGHTKSLAKEMDIDGMSDKTLRLVSWCEEVLQRILKQIIHKRNQYATKTNFQSIESGLVRSFNSTMVIEQVSEIITLPEFDPKAKVLSSHNSAAKLDELVVEQLGMFVRDIASLYRNNAFHNFEHASHVTMSVVKLLSRIVAPSEVDYSQMDDTYSLHDHTYGITSDPLTQFSCVLSALIHDLDHPGVPNAQLVKEQSTLAILYKNKSVAEQNSVDIAWGFLSKDKYADLRKAIYCDEVEMNRFRQLVVNSVMATDIVDRELKELRNKRWDTAFLNTNDSTAKEDGKIAVNRKATIVIEHLIQASDVVHTMQHWHVYRKWNEKFFVECCEAYRNGRAEVDPSTNWYEGEIGFFDYYIIPLAKKLKECGVFGVSSDEYLNYAVKNRTEWETRGKEIVTEMVEKVNRMKKEGPKK